MHTRSEPLVSVMFPAYNQVAFVEAALRSAVEQDYPNLQIIVRDDGSTDGTREVIREFGARYADRITVIDEGINLGITANCNRILRECRGELIAFHAGDDLWLPGKVRRQVDWFAADARRVLCGHDVETFESATNRTLYHFFDILPPRAGVGAEEWVRRGVLFGGIAMMVRRSAMPPHAYDPRVPYASDWLLWIECLAAGGHFGYVEGVLARYRRHDANITRSIGPGMRDDLFVTLALVESRYPHLVESCRLSRAGMYRLAGVHALRANDKPTARSYWRAALRQQLEPRALAALALCYLPAGLGNRVVSRFRYEPPV